MIDLLPLVWILVQRYRSETNIVMNNDVTDSAEFISVQIMWPERSHLLMPLLILWCHHELPAAYGCMCLSAGGRLRWHSFFNVLLITPSPHPPPASISNSPSWLGLTVPEDLEAASRTLSLFLHKCSKIKDQPEMLLQSRRKTRMI